jgi:hypothetical protein
MTKGRLAIIALVAGVAVGTRASQRTAAAARRTPSLVTHQLRREVAALEDRFEERADQLDRDRRRSVATVLAIAILIVVPAVLVTTRPDVPDVVIAVVLAVDLAVAAVALLVAARAGRVGRNGP